MRDWTMDVPVIAVVDGLGDRFVQLVEASCAKYDWQLERFSTVADALNAGLYRLRSGSIATAASPHSVEAQWGGRDRAPYKIMLVVAEPGNAEAGVFYMGGNLKGGNYRLRLRRRPVR
jgi:hypothetical protein